MATATIRLTGNILTGRTVCGSLGAQRRLTSDDDLWMGATDHCQAELTRRGVTFATVTSIPV